MSVQPTAESPWSVRRLFQRQLRGRARVGGARQHAVLRRHPALARPAEERRDFVLHTGRADDARLTDLDQHRAFSVRQKMGVMETWRNSSGERSFSRVMRGKQEYQLWRRREQRVVLLQRSAKIDVAGERVGLSAVDENLHLLQRRKIGEQRVHDRVHREQLLRRSARMLRAHCRIEIHEHFVLTRHIDAAHGRAFGDGRRQRFRRLCRELCLENRARLFDKRAAERDLLRQGHQTLTVLRREIQRCVDLRGGWIAAARRCRRRRRRGVRAWHRRSQQPRQRREHRPRQGDDGHRHAGDERVRAMLRHSLSPGIQEIAELDQRLEDGLYDVILILRRGELRFLIGVREISHLDECGGHVGANEYTERRLSHGAWAHLEPRAQGCSMRPARVDDCSR